MQEYALRFSGYEAMGGFDQCADLANESLAAFEASGAIPESESEVRACLFFEARRWRHAGEDPHETAWPYIEALLQYLDSFDGARVTKREDEYRRSGFYEQLVEHVFISELLQEAWFGFGEAVEVLRSEVDASGYDVVFECRGILRHVQLKTSRHDSKTSSQKVSVALGEKPGGCVVWLLRSEDYDACRMSLEYLYFGGPTESDVLPSLEGFSVAKHTKPNAVGIKAERPGLRVVPKKAFKRIGTQRQLLGELFGLR